VAHRVIFPLKG